MGFVGIMLGFTYAVLEHLLTNCVFRADRSVVCQLCSLQNSLLLIPDACRAFLCGWDTLVSGNGGSLKAESIHSRVHSL